MYLKNVRQGARHEEPLDTTSVDAPAALSKPVKPRKPRARPATDSQRLLSGSQVETLMGIPYRTIYDLHVRGVLPAVQFPSSRKLWFLRTDVEALIASSRGTRS